MANALDRGWQTILGAAIVLPLYGCVVGRIHSTTESPEAALPAFSPSNAGNAYGDAPNIYGSRLHMPPGESAAARALELADQLALSKTENEQLASRIRDMQAELEAKDKALARATADVIESRSELANARTELERWKQELVVMRDKLQAADKENLTTLQTTVALLQELLARDENADAGSQK